MSDTPKTDEAVKVYANEGYTAHRVFIEYVEPECARTFERQINTLTADIQALITKWQKDALTYAKQHPVPPGSSPGEITEDQQHAVNISGAYRVCAHELKNILTKHTRP